MRRKLTAAALSGLVCPGAGQIYNRQRAKGALLIAVTLVILAVVFYVTCGAAIDVALTMPPEEILQNPFGLAHRIVEANKAFYDRAGLALLAIWVYGIADAYLKADKVNPPEQE